MIMYDNCKKKRDELIKNLKVKMCPEDIVVSALICIFPIDV